MQIKRNNLEFNILKTYSKCLFLKASDKVILSEYSISEPRDNPLPNSKILNLYLFCKGFKIDFIYSLVCSPSGLKAKAKVISFICSFSILLIKAERLIFLSGAFSVNLIFLPIKK